MKKLIFFFCALFASPLYAQQEGTLDGDFDADGLVVLRENYLRYGESANAVAIQPDGRIVVAGVELNNLSDPSQILARFHPDGSRDLSFHLNVGHVTIPNYNAYKIARFAEAMVILSNGTIITGGNSGLNTFALNAITPDGELDLTFESGGTGGSIHYFQNAYLYDLALDTSWYERIVSAGSAFDGTTSNFALARNTADGHMDGFSFDGHVTTDFYGRNDAAYAVAVHSNSKYIAVGASNESIALAQYMNDGTLDLGFGQGGKVITALGSQSYASDVAIQSDGKIVIAGFAVINGENNGFVARYDTDGKIDSTFGTHGFSFRVDGNFTSVAVQPDDKIVAAGASVSTQGYLVMRFTAHGSPDASFGFQGKGETVFSAEARALALQPDGKIVVAGYILENAIPHIAVARYHASSSATSINPLQVAIESRIYPNPVFSNATLEFELPSANQVSISLLNVNGQRISQPVPTMNLGPGKHTIPLLAEDLLPGMYLLQMKAGAHLTVTRFAKM